LQFSASVSRPSLACKSLAVIIRHENHREINMKPIIVFLFATIISNLTLAQIDWTKTDTTKSVYKNLKTKKFYALSYTYGGTDYEIENKVVTKKTFQKYHKTWKNMENCKPCILLTYDINDHLIFKGIQYVEIQVGYWIEYYPNGKVKLIGHYKENSKGNWNDFFNVEDLQKEDGVFTFYNENGEELYSEYWKEGQFVKQFPEQIKTELWNIELTLDSMNINNKVLACREFKSIIINPKFKNNTTTGANISIDFSVSIIGKKPINKRLTIDEFKTIDVCKILEELDIKLANSASCTMLIYSKDEIICDYNLTIIP
jgi:hypothetical protein